MTRDRKMSAIGAFLFILAWAVPAYPGGTVQSFGKEKPVTLEDFRPRLMDKEWYNESWSYNVHLEDGSFIAVDFRVSNIAVTSDHNGVFHARFMDPDEKNTKCGIDLDDDEWSYSKSGFSLNFRNGKVSGDLEGSSVTVRCKNLSMDLKFENQLKPYKPGGGTLRFGKGDGVYSMVFMSPRARVTGTVTLKGKARQIEGVGLAMHTRYDMRPDKQVHRWFRFKHVDNDVSVIMAEMEAVKEYMGTRNGWVLVLDSKGRILATTRARFQHDGFVKDTGSKEGYKIPRRVRVVAVDGDTQLIGVLTMKGLKKVVDFTDRLNPVSRAIVRRFTKPRDYHINCSFHFKVGTKENTREIKGEGVYRFFYINP